MSINKYVIKQDIPHTNKEVTDIIRFVFISFGENSLCLKPFLIRNSEDIPKPIAGNTA